MIDVVWSGLRSIGEHFTTSRLRLKGNQETSLLLLKLLPQASSRALITSSPRFRASPSRCLRTATIPQADPTLTTQMKSVGEAMAIGRTFKESLQKRLRSLEIGRSGLGGDGKVWRIGTETYGDRDILPRDVISRKLSMPNAERIFFKRGQKGVRPN
jgi:hypothetical protein